MIARTFFFWILCGLGVVSQLTASSLLWKVTGPDGDSYLFGTVHLPHPEVSAIPDVVREKLAKVNGLWTEVRMDVTVDAKLSESMLLPDRGRLRDLLTEEENEQFARVLGGLHPSLTPLMFDQYRPLWAVALMTILPLQWQYPLEEPLDKRLWDEAVRMGKEVGSIETVEEQTTVFDSFTIEEQLELFRLSLRDHEVSVRRDGVSPLTKLIAAYRSGKPTEIERIVKDVEGADTPIYNLFLERLLYERNRLFVERIGEQINEGGRWMFAFGAGHLGGARGVEVLLREQGFEVNPIPID